jgi:hypothetical protein
LQGIEKISGSFMNEEFFRSLERITESRENHEEQTFFENFIDFAYQCYLHGITAGFETAAEFCADKQNKQDKHNAKDKKKRKKT